MKFSYQALHLCLATFTWSLLAGCFPLSAPDPCSSPGPPTYKVLVEPAADSRPLSPSPDEEYFCDPSQIKSIEAAIESAREMAEKAAQLLQRPDAHLSEAVTTFLGKTGKPGKGITAERLAEIVQMRFANVQQSYSGVHLTQVDALDRSGTDQSVYFTCPKPDSAAEKAEKCNKESQANTVNLGLPDGEGGEFKNTKQTYQNLVKTNPNRMNNFDNPACPGLTLLHEAQHSLPILQSSDEPDNLDDRYRKIGDGTGPRIYPKFKQDNAENVAILVAEDRFATPVNTDTAGTIGARFY
ncbi:hypothetical protein C8J57DRAFT_1482839 [Mycena rebaudengoi]|nr:hypothetical protein C8J57DRAFT_1482839 [Mycena rebaudengoi]